MRMVKIQNKSETLEEVAKKFLLVKEAQHCSENIFKIKLREIGRRVLRGTLTEENAIRVLLQLMKDYLRYKKEAASA